ncbi:pyrroline-5-carboxylate reductase [Georgenia sp. 10Sc9-8]|uniref:Pyrroline-5-carboxylate reductase n=1 Tax=Georgenia halotolerans TaxID=3028317 RepID=A0ABT5TZI2_9MICO|nr:pyrroline-5-carboxylate reductase [Georgenia halotolerans]
MRVGFVGAGNMAGAIARGIIAAGEVAGSDVVLVDARAEAGQALAEEVGATVAPSAAELVATCDVVVLAVKPQVLPEVVTDLAADLVRHRPLLVSIAAGTSLDAIEALLPGDAGLAVVRVMPNVNAMIGAGMAAVCGNVAAGADDAERVRALFATVGEAIVLPERDFSAYTAIAGSAPAFAFAFVDALARGAVKNGLPKAQATRIAAQTLLGSARMVLERAEDGVTPADLVDMVSSPGGTTVAGTCAMEDAGFSPAVVRGVQATIDRDREMGAGG